MHPNLKDCTFKVACDVKNPLYGPNGAAFLGFLNTELQPGIELVLKINKMEEKLQNVHYVITGEEKLDF